MSRRSISTQQGRSLVIPVEPLSPESFSPFGTVLISPFASDLHQVPSTRSTNNKATVQIPDPNYSKHQPKAVEANQGTALKTAPIGPLVQNYPEPEDGQGRSSNKVEGRMTMFSCFPRQISTSTDNNINSNRKDKSSDRSKRSKNLLNIKILERHPYTTQTFCPLFYTPTNLIPNTNSTISHPSSFLVIVAPNDNNTEAKLPDLTRIRAFISTSPPSQAVTYDSGTWHAPMIVLGPQRIDFVVTQFVNGIPDDECQEVDIIGDNVWVDLNGIDDDNDKRKKAKL